MRRPADYSPLIASLLAALRGKKRPVKLAKLATSCGLPARKTQYLLRCLEQRGVVERPHGARRGYRLCTDAPLPSASYCSYRKASNADDLVDVLRHCQSPVKGVVLADLCGIPPRTAQYWLKRLAQQGLVECPRGARSGWQLRRARMSNLALPSAHLC